MSLKERFYELHLDVIPKKSLKRELKKTDGKRLVAELEVSIDEKRRVTTKQHQLILGVDPEEDAYVDAWLARNRRECEAIVRAS